MNITFTTYISEKEIDLLLEELRMYKRLVDYARGLDDRGLRIFKSMFKRVLLLDDIKNKQILNGVLASIIDYIEYWYSFDKMIEKIDNKIDELMCAKREAGI